MFDVHEFAKAVGIGFADNYEEVIGKDVLGIKKKKGKSFLTKKNLAYVISLAYEHGFNHAKKIMSNPNSISYEPEGTNQKTVEEIQRRD